MITLPPIEMLDHQVKGFLLFSRQVITGGSGQLDHDRSELTGAHVNHVFLDRPHVVHSDLVSRYDVIRDELLNAGSTTGRQESAANIVE